MHVSIDFLSHDQFFAYGTFGIDGELNGSIIAPLPIPTTGSKWYKIHGGYYSHTNSSFIALRDTINNMEYNIVDEYDFRHNLHQWIFLPPNKFKSQAAAKYYLDSITKHIWKAEKENNVKCEVSYLCK